MKVVFPVYNMDRYNWDRVSAVLEPISKHHDVTVFYYDDVSEPDVDWCQFIKIPKYRNLVNLHKTSQYALEIIMKVADFDVLYCFSSGSYFQMLSVLIAQEVNKPIVMHLNGDGALSRGHHLNPSDKIVQDTVDRITLNNVDLIVPISTILQKAVLTRVKDASRVSEPVPFSVDLNHFHPQRFPEEVTIGYGGRISPEKGFPFFTDVIKSTPQQKYRLAGPIQMHILFPDNAHYMGCLTLRDMVYFYGLNSVIALPSYGEGMPAMILEAYASGRPVLVTPESRPSELPLFGWELPHDLDAWIHLVKTLNLREIRKRGLEARAWMEKHWPTWEDFGKNMAELFEKVVN